MKCCVQSRPETGWMSFMCPQNLTSRVRQGVTGKYGAVSLLIHLKKMVFVGS